MNIQDFKCNGIGNTQPALGIKPIVQTAISVFRLRRSNDEIIASFPIGYDYYIGHRFTDDETVATRICSGLVEYAEQRLYKESGQSAPALIVEQYIDALVNSLSGSEMDQMILEAMRDCASSDHWYTFEKQWN
jgi:hypothetical protein